MLRSYEDQDPDDALVTTLAEEREINTFFRLDSPSMIASWCGAVPELGDKPDAAGGVPEAAELGIVVDSRADSCVARASVLHSHSSASYDVRSAAASC